MEKESPKRMKTAHLCFPRFRGNTTCTIKNRLSPMTLLDRFREAVFRLMMLSALSKANNNNNHVGVKRSSYHRPADPHHREAVADCIEFIKKTSVMEENSGRDSTVSGSMDVTTEMVMPVPVM